MPVEYDKIVAKMISPDDHTRLDAIQQCRKTLSRARNPPIEEFFQRGAVKILAGALDDTEYAAF